MLLSFSGSFSSYFFHSEHFVFLNFSEGFCAFCLWAIPEVQQSYDAHELVALWLQIWLMTRVTSYPFSEDSHIQSSLEKKFVVHSNAQDNLCSRFLGECFAGHANNDCAVSSKEGCRVTLYTTKKMFIFTFLSQITPLEFREDAAAKVELSRPAFILCLRVQDGWFCLKCCKL